MNPGETRKNTGFGFYTCRCRGRLYSKLYPALFFLLFAPILQSKVQSPPLSLHEVTGWLNPHKGWQTTRAVKYFVIEIQENTYV